MAWSEDDDIALGGYADSNDVGSILRDYTGRLANHLGGDVSIQYKPDGSSVLNVLGENGKVISSSPTDIESLRTYIPTVFTKAIQPEFVKQQQPHQYAQQKQQKQSGMDMDMLQNLGGGSGFAPSRAADTSGASLTDSSAPFGTAGSSVVDVGASGIPMGANDFAGSSAATSNGSGLMDFNAPFGSTGGAEVAPGTASTGADTPGMFGDGGSLGGGWASAAGGALNGYLQGRENYKNDPNMWSGKDGYGKYHKDYRAEVGGGFLGGVLGYYGGPVGAAVAGPVTKAVHPYAEKGTREVINFGDKVGGAGGALALDPIGTVSTGKYSWGEIGRGALLGPLDKLFK